MEEISHANESLGLPTVAAVDIDKVDTVSTTSDISTPGTSLNTMIKTGFLHLMKTVAPLYKVPSRMTVAQMIDAKYNILSL